MLRRWTFGYTQDPANGVSLLGSVGLTGVAADGGHLGAPPLQFGYSQFGDPELLQLDSDDGALPTLARQSTGRVELVDWNGDGLPDVVEFGGDGNASVWTNSGKETFTGPSRAGITPLAASAQAALAFADMDGDGFADLIRLDRPLSGFVPRTAPGGFGQPVSFSQAPASIPGAANVRLLDLTGDGSVDLMSSSEGGLALYYRDPAVGWSMQPQIVTSGEGPVRLPRRSARLRRRHDRRRQQRRGAHRRRRSDVLAVPRQWALGRPGDDDLRAAAPVRREHGQAAR